MTFDSTAARDKVQFGLHVGHSPSYIVGVESQSTVDGQTYQSKYDMSFAPGMEVGIDLWYLPKESWGFLSGIDIGPERRLRQIAAQGIVLDVPADSETIKYQTHFLRLGAAYRWDIFYVPVGLAYGDTTMTVPRTTSATPILAVENGLGMFFGLGWVFGDTLVIEYIGRSASSGFDYREGADSEQAGTVIGSAVLNIKVMF